MNISKSEDCHISDSLLARLESAYSLIWGSHEIWGKGGGSTFMISWPI